MQESNDLRHDASAEGVPVTYASKGGASTRQLPNWVWSFGIVTLLTVVMVLLSLRTPNNRTRQSQCAWNLSSLGKGLVVYANENGDQFAPTLERLTSDGLASGLHLISPYSGHRPPACDYFYVTGLTAEDPRDWVLAYGDPVYLKGLGGNVLFCDSHVEFLKEPQFSQALARFKSAYEQARGKPPVIIPPQ